MSVQILQGDALDMLATLPSESVACCVTSPPYWGLRDYGVPPQVWSRDPECEHEWQAPLAHGRRGSRGISGTGGNMNPSLATVGQGPGAGTGGRFCTVCGGWEGCLGLEPTIDMFVNHMVLIFREVRRVLRKDGTLWLNLGDAYACAPNGRSAAATKDAGNDDRTFRDKPFSTVGGPCKPKDLLGQPWRVAFALQADGWWLRSDIIWHKPNPMPESVTDRPVRAHEYLFLLSKAERYYYDYQAVKEPFADGRMGRSGQKRSKYELAAAVTGRRDGGIVSSVPADGRNRRTVWTIPTRGFPGAHFATFPPALVTPPILAGSQKGDVVLDPFGGSGTVGMVAQQLERRAILIEVKPEYCEIARGRVGAPK